MTFFRRTATALLASLFIGTSVGSGSLTYAQDSDVPKDSTPAVNSSLISPLRFRNIGPALMSGRIADIAVDPTKRSTWYIAAASGGVWKTENAGVTFRPIFDNYGSYSIGCVTIDPKDRFTVWVGTGENNSQRSVGFGDGVYKSTNGGKSFQKVGLENSEHIGKIIVHPKNSDVVFVAAQGPLWKSGGDRGLFKTTDGGKTWKNVLKISKHTGINEVHMDPKNPNIMYACSYQRRRHTWVLIDGGPETTIYKSTDGGNTWKKSARGLPGVDKGKIGMAVSPINPEVVYAVVEAAKGQSGFYRSSDRGESWSKMSSYVSGSPQYYNELIPCPHKMDRIYAMDTYLHVSEDGGKNFTRLGEADKHVDNHALVVDPRDPDHLLVGCDGGVYETWDRGRTYDYKANLPITQFYKVAVSTDKPFYFVYGGTQDNATQGGPSRTTNIHGIRNSDWFITVFGDGFDPAVDPEDPDTVYSQWQYGGLVRFNRKTNLNVDIKPQPAVGGPALRWNWDSALAISPHNSKRIYYGSQILFQSDDRGDNWKAISGDLSRNLDRNKLKVMDRIWEAEAVAKNASTSLYGTIVSVSESPLQEGLIYVGTDDGMVQVTEDGGQSWRAVSKFDGLDIPEFGYINDIEADLHDADTVYVAINNHKRGDFRPYVVMSTDRGKTWKNITSNLPERGSVYTLKQDHVKPKLLFCGTEYGCFTSTNGGKKWIAMKSGLPTVAIRDIEIQKEADDLVLASFGRGFYILDDYSPLREVTKDLSKKNKIFPIKKGKMYMESAPLAVGRRAFQGANYYTAANPPVGVTFTYHLNETLRTAKSKRLSKDARLKAAGKDTPYPTWDQFKAEDREIGPQVFLTIKDSEGNVVSRINGSTSKGIHRAVWNFRHGGRRGALAVPGTYSVEISKFAGGKVTKLVGPTEFEIEPLNFGLESEPDRAAILAFSKKANRLGQAVTAASQVAASVSSELDAMEKVLSGDPKMGHELLNEVRAAKVKMLDLMEKFNGDPTKTRRNESAYPGFASRVRTMAFGAMGSYEGPTGTHMSQYDIVVKEFSEAKEILNEMSTKVIPTLRKKLDEAGAGWTVGRKIPEIK